MVNIARIILTSRYLKGNKKGFSKKNFVCYIGTRENVDLIKSDTITMATKKQKNFIKELADEYTNINMLLEYEDYKKNPTIDNASELIDVVLERISESNEDREKYVKYIAKRPRSEKIKLHGLFSSDGEVKSLHKKAKEISEHQGNVWSHVLSLRRGDAEKLGYNNYKAFKDLVDENIVCIAKAHKIKIENLKYVCAFHNESYHPHIHLLVYSKNEKEGYLSNTDIEQLRSKFANCIFRDDMYHNFSTQNILQKEIRQLSKIECDKILNKINNYKDFDEDILLIVKELHSKMKLHKGTKSYKWFCKKGNEEIRNLIDELAKKICKDENINMLYNDWYEAKENNLKIYKTNVPERIPIYENDTFRPLKNYIINEVLKLDINSNNIKEGKEENVEEAINKSSSDKEYLVKTDVTDIENHNISNEKLVINNKIDKSKNKENELYLKCCNDIYSYLASLIIRSSNSEKGLDKSQSGDVVDKKVRGKIIEKKKDQGLRY